MSSHLGAEVDDADVDAGRRGRDRHDDANGSSSAAGPEIVCADAGAARSTSSKPARAKTRSDRRAARHSAPAHDRRCASPPTLRRAADLISARMSLDGACFGSSPERRSSGHSIVVVCGSGLGPRHARQLEPRRRKRGRRLAAAVTLTFNENVEIPLGALRLFDCSGKRIDIGAPHHGPSSREVEAEPPEARPRRLPRGVARHLRRLAPGARRVHVLASGRSAGQSACATTGAQKSSSTVGFLFGLDRVLLFAGLALLIGGGVFLVLIARDTSAARRTRAIAWIGWGVTLVATVAGIMLQGPYGEGTGIGDAFKWSIVRDILRTHYGRDRREAACPARARDPCAHLLEARLHGSNNSRRGASSGCGAVAVGLAATPGLAGHASTGDETFFAVPLDTLHVLAMSIWLGGLVALLAGALGGDVQRRSPPGHRRVLATRVLVGRGARGHRASSRRGARSASRSAATLDTSYGNILLVKIAIVAVLVGVAAVSRSIVRKRQAAPLDAPDSVIAAVDEQTVLGLRRIGRRRGRARPRRAGRDRPARQRAAGAQRARAEAVHGGGQGGHGHQRDADRRHRRPGEAGPEHDSRLHPVAERPAVPGQQHGRRHSACPRRTSTPFSADLEEGRTESLPRERRR